MNSYDISCDIYEVDDSGEETQLYVFNWASSNKESDVITLKSNVKYRIALSVNYATAVN
jgi:hypothetical protein